MCGQDTAAQIISGVGRRLQKLLLVWQTADWVRRPTVLNSTSRRPSIDGSTVFDAMEKKSQRKDEREATMIWNVTQDRSGVGVATLESRRPAIG